VTGTFKRLEGAAIAGRRPFSIEGEVLVLGGGVDEVRFRRVTDEFGDTAAVETIEVSGWVSYRQRVALPPGAVVTVRLSDVSRADAPSTVIRPWCAV
jgi:Type III secretion system lipoprotein chaperone (YscW)